MSAGQDQVLPRVCTITTSCLHFAGDVLTCENVMKEWKECSVHRPAKAYAYGMLFNPAMHKLSSAET